MASIQESIGADSALRRAAAASEAALAPYDILGTPPEAPYDDIAQLARDLCETPVALVTLFDTGQQWLKAAAGFDASRTTLSDALCANAIEAEDVLVIPDLSRDARTANNALVIGPPGARFYAGAPLRLADGTFLGTLCAIDLVARPAGLAASQLNGLRTLARQVTTLLELRRLVAERDAALVSGDHEKRRLTASEAHWRGLFQGLREGFMIAEVIRDDAGRVIDWRHLEANAAFEAVVGHAPGAVVGKTIGELTPDMPRPWIDFVGRAMKHGEGEAFALPVRRAGRTYEGRVFPIGGEQFATIFLDVTDRVAAERRQQALITIGDQLLDLDRVEDMTQAAARVIGETLGVTRVGYGRLDPAQETIALEPDWTAPGAASIAGTHRFADYGTLLADLLVGQPLVVADVRTDPRTATDPDRLRAMGVTSLINIPVRERGRTTALLVVHHDQPRQWAAEEVAFLREIADRLELALGRLDAEGRRVVQTQEMSHRVKNTLAMVQAIASQTLKPVTERAAVDVFEKRLTALATAHDVLLGSEWEAAPLMVVIRSVLETAGQEERVTCAGPPVELAPRAVLSASLLIHELATNAVKYGALSAPSGRVDISWTIRNRDGRPTLFLEWTERGGPPASPPARRGFGSRLINMGLAGTGGVDLLYAEAGFAAKLAAPVDDLTKN